MKDEEFVFRQESKRGKNGFGAHGWSPSRRGSVRLPSDGLSRKEKKALNGDVNTYNLRWPMSWAVFKAMPIDLQREYAEWLERSFFLSGEMATELFGVGAKTWTRYRIEKLGFAPFKRRRRSPTVEEKASFEIWLNNVTESAEDLNAEADDVIAETVAAEAVEKDEADTTKPKAMSDVEFKALLDKYPNPPWEDDPPPALLPEVKRGDLTVTCTPYELSNFVSSLIGAERVTFRVSWGDA